jgi:non-homologous end joining protein Ku
VAIRASAGRLVIQEVRRAGEVRDPREIVIPDAEVTEQEVDLGLGLAERMYVPAFNAAAYPDRRYEATVALLQRKIDGGEIRVPEANAPVPPSSGGSVISLADALAKQIAELGPRKGPKRAARTMRARPAPAKAG